MKPTRTKLTKTVLWFALTIGAVWAMALSHGCATIPADKVIEAATKCIQDATTILAAQAESVATQRAIKDLQDTEAYEQVAPSPAPPQPEPGK